MKILIDINHPAHVHFFKNAARILSEKGHEVVFTSRKKECAVELLNENGFSHTVLSEIKDGSIFGLLGELVKKTILLLKFFRTFKPDVMCAIGGTFIAHSGFIAGVRRIAFYDTEIAYLQNFITYPFLNQLYVPDSYYGKVPASTTRYSGFHELAYLSSDYFKPDVDVAKKIGLKIDQKNYLLRVVSWNANHDIGESGWSEEIFSKVFEYLSQSGNVIISTERTLPDIYREFQYQGPPSQLHHLLAHCNMYVGESATMASEAAMLGVPAVYAASTTRGYLNYLQDHYGIVSVITDVSFERIKISIENYNSADINTFKVIQARIRSETVDVTGFIVEVIERV